MQYVITLDRDDFLRVLAALHKDADRLEELSMDFPEEEWARKFIFQAKDTRKLYRKILEEYETID